MKRLFAIIAMAAVLAGCGQKGPKPAQISGAGATFPAPLYQQWASDYLTGSGVRVSYQGIGSGGGILQIHSATIDFGGTDKPLTADELDKGELLQFPAAIGGVVPVVNLNGVPAGKLRLSGPVLADIFAGTIKMWNDPRLAALNPGLALPKLPISVVHRSDGSGTTFLFTSYLAAQSSSWKSGPGASDSIAWPTGIGGKGNDGVAAFVRQTLGSIGYVEYAYAVRNNLAFTMMQNPAGVMVEPGAKSFAAAASGADWSHMPGFYLLLLDRPGDDAWPISGASFILVRRDAPEDRRRAVYRFFDWAFSHGDASAAKLGYLPLPDRVKAAVRTSWGDDGPVTKP
jgi:phosphate transport system substrate-binding protein